MISLKEYIINSLYHKTESLLTEGGITGHMSHVIDYSDLTGRDLIELVEDLFNGKIEDITEKVDGMNIQATINNSGEVVFIRNNSDLNSENGGMTIGDMIAKWKDKPSVAETFVKCGEIITMVFNKVGKKFFNPSPNVKYTVNCECVVTGKTNIIPYVKDNVFFHNIWVYEKIDNKYKNIEVTKKGLDIINKACDGIDKAMLTPKVMIDTVKDNTRLITKYTNQIKKIFNNNLNQTIDDYKYSKFLDIIKNEFINKSNDLTRILYNRWFNQDKSVNLREIKKNFDGNELTEFIALDKAGYKDLIFNVNKDLDNLFIEIGNDIIKLTKGLLNSGYEDSVIGELLKDLEEVKDNIYTKDDIDLKNKLIRQLDRIGHNDISSAEGIVFTYKNKLMKITGTFAPLNQILGTLKYANT